MIVYLNKIFGFTYITEVYIQYNILTLKEVRLWKEGVCKLFSKNHSKERVLTQKLLTVQSFESK